MAVRHLRLLAEMLLFVALIVATARMVSLERTMGTAIRLMAGGCP